MVVQADPIVMRGVAEFFEDEIGECLVARTESLVTFRELGPPDLCHIIKNNPKNTPKDIGSYHYVLGTDASSSATLAAYLNSLMYLLGSAPIKNNPWKIKSGTYCCFNAFSRVDVRVDVKIPGGVDAYLVDLRGDRHPIANPDIWQETFVSAVLRSIHDDNDDPDGNDGSPILGLRKLDPLPTLHVERRFLEAAAGEFWKGWQLGTEPEVQVATHCSNHLTRGIIKYFSEAGRLSEAARFFEQMATQDPEITAVLAEAYLGMDEEIKAVSVIHDRMKRRPLSYELLLTQVDFLMSKKQYDKALKIAKVAVTHAPSEFYTWAKLTSIYIEIQDYESALLALNSCPMFTYCEKDAHRMPPPARTHLPLRSDTSQTKSESEKQSMPSQHGTLAEENDPRENEVHPELQRLPSMTLRGTFYKAYELLIRIVGKVGWDELLRYRSVVFVMEDEYRVHRSIAEESARSAPLAEDIDNEGESNQGTATKTKDLVGHMDNISLEDDPSFRPSGSKSPEKTQEASGSLGKARLSIDELMKKAEADTKRTTSTTSAPSESKGRAPNPRTNNHRVSFSFKYKRLCEKWLDNLFMVLYNDLRLYTALKQEMTQFKYQAGASPSVMLYRKTGSEWEIYADLAARLNYRDDARDAFMLCLEQKVSPKALMKLFLMAAEDGQIQACLSNCVKLVALQDRTYVEHTYPSIIAKGLFTLIRKHGLAKVQNALISMNIPPGSFRYITRYFEYAEVFRVAGATW